MLLFYKLIISAANLQSGNQLKQQSPIKKLLLNGTTFFYYPVEMYNGNFHTGTLYKNYSGASYDMCVTNGMDYNFYVENGQNSLKMGFYYAVPESLICTNHYDYCSHSLNQNERVIHYDPLINLNCEPNINYKMNFCQECRKYYFFYLIENEETNHFEQQVNGINKKTTQSNKTEASIGLSTMRKNSDKGFKKHNKNTGTINVKSKDLESTNEEITTSDKCMKEVVSESQNIHIGSEKNLQNDNPKPILIPYSQVLKISSMLASKDSNRMPDSSKNKANESRQKVSIENRKEKKTSLKFGRNTSINTATKNEKIQSYFYMKTSNEASVKKVFERKNSEQVKNSFSKTIQNNSKETDSISEIKTTNRYDQLETEENKEIYDNETENSVEENITNDCINNPGTNQDKQMFKNHKKRNKKIKSGKNAGAIKNNEISEFTIDFTLEDQPVFNMELPLKHKDDSNNSNWENSFVYYQFKSLRTFYVHDDLEFLKAVFMTKHPEIFKNYEKYLYRFSHDIQKTITHKDYQELKMHKEQDLKKSKELLKEDCDSYFLFYAENDGIFPNTDFILLQDALQVPKVRNNLGTFETKTKNKFIRRYEITKDRLVVFLFYFFQEYHLRNINVAFLREFTKFFFKFKNSKKILNSSKIFICIIFNYSFKIAKVLEESALDFAVLVYGDKIGSNSQFTVLINELGNFILENKIKEMNLNWFLKFISGLKVISNAEKNDIYSMAKEKKHTIEELKLEGRNKNEYFE